MLVHGDTAQTGKAHSVFADRFSTCIASSMEKIRRLQADAKRVKRAKRTKMELSEATATKEWCGYVVLDFGVDSMPANSVLLRLASPQGSTAAHYQGGCGEQGGVKGLLRLARTCGMERR
mmetsp:Transcript_20227/g.47567  ORF Transcript_20227/g.47567 Transcript_20227/m.47567 type:complete len:120 (-) Transcript_20227:74-433(-)